VGKGKNSRAASSKRVIEEDEEQILKVIDREQGVSHHEGYSVSLAGSCYQRGAIKGAG
jgi:hypothetical protein